MDLADASICMTYESGPTEFDDFPQTDEPVHILGHAYSTLYDLEELKHDILSRIWITYRKNFSPIGGTGPTADTGWGCMLRCGQMMMAQCLIVRHLGRGWRWKKSSYENDKIYMKILRLFQDKRTSYYSIHQIASMGVSEGKTVGSWFGPNTIAQVLKKISVYDEWSSIVTHVAMDNTVIEDDIRTLCKSHANKENTQQGSNPVPAGAASAACPSSGDTVKEGASSWSPLLLIIPLRLGLTDINSLYFNSLKLCLSLKQSVGIIGGKPNHAHWFIGTVGDELVYLDPHTTQPVVDLVEVGSRDDSYHCPHSSRMKVQQLDPSVALGFFCLNEQEFDDLCNAFRSKMVSKTPMFELHRKRPKHWPADSYVAAAAAATGTTKTVYANADFCDTEEEFELLG